MSHPSWVGAIGGVKGQALYIVGSYEGKAIFLDPHLVQDNEEEMEVWSYSCQTPRSMDLSCLSPSLSFCYYVRSREEHVEWLQWVETLNEVYYPNLIFELMLKSTKEKVARQLEEIEKQMKSAEITVRDPSSGDVEIMEDKSGDFICVESRKSIPSERSSRKSLEAPDRVVEDSAKSLFP